MSLPALMSIRVEAPFVGASESEQALHQVGHAPHLLQRLFDHLHLQLGPPKSGTGRQLLISAPGPRAQALLDAFVKEMA